jgi:type IX secretion system PorP/SprF family membrane protein
MFFGSGLVKAQQLPLYSQYIMNGFLLNPAVAGSDGYTTFNLTAREQWVGFENAPRTHAFSIQTRILKESYIIKSTPVRKKVFKPSTKGRVGIGGYIFNDKNGLVNRTGIQLTYAYHIWLRETQLSFGLSGSTFQFRVNDEELTFYDQREPLLTGDLRKAVYVPDASFGIYLSHYSYNVGFSVAQLFQSYIKLGNQSLKDYRMLRHYYLMGAYRFDLNVDYQLEPSVLFKTTETWIFQADINCKLYYKNDYWAGLSFRTNGALIAMAGIKVNQFYFGYAFDYTLTSIRKHSFGSHEVMIALKLGDSARRFRWLDRY